MRGSLVQHDRAGHIGVDMDKLLLDGLEFLTYYSRLSASQKHSVSMLLFDMSREFFVEIEVKAYKQELIAEKKGENVVSFRRIRRNLQ